MASVLVSYLAVLRLRIFAVGADVGRNHCRIFVTEKRKCSISETLLGCIYDYSKLKILRYVRNLKVSSVIKETAGRWNYRVDSNGEHS